MQAAWVSGKWCEAPVGDYYVVCSFDPTHVLLRSRMPYHIIKCVKRHPGHNKLQCPYDATEYIDSDQMPNHLLTCESKRALNEDKYKIADILQQNNMGPHKRPVLFRQTIPTMLDEDWTDGNDDEDNSSNCSTNELNISNDADGSPAHEKNAVNDDTNAQNYFGKSRLAHENNADNDNTPPQKCFGRSKLIQNTPQKSIGRAEVLKRIFQEYQENQRLKQTRKSGMGRGDVIKRIQENQNMKYSHTVESNKVAEDQFLDA